MNENGFLDYLAQHSDFSKNTLERISEYVAKFDEKQALQVLHEEAPTANESLLKDIEKYSKKNDTKVLENKENIAFEKTVVEVTENSDTEPKEDLYSNIETEKNSAFAELLANELGASYSGTLMTPQDTMDSSILMNPEKKETILHHQDRYDIIETLGEGGMGIVQLAYDRLLEREVALKKVKTKGRESKVLSQKQQMMLWRFKREAAITATLEHPNIVPLHDMEVKADGEFQFTMRKVQGDTLRDILRKRRKEKNGNESTRLLSIFLKICDAVAYAHSRGIIHRDLKPENIMVGQFGEVYVMDWGIAKQFKTGHNKNSSLHFETPAEEAIESGGFQTMGAIGTPGYSSPEQLSDASLVTPSSDLFALGKILRECFTYLSPLEEFKKKIDALEKKEKNNRTLPLDIQAIVKKATEEDIEERYQTVQELSEDVDRYRKNARVSVREYTIFEIFGKWLTRNKQRVFWLSVVLLLSIFFPLYFSWQKLYEKEKNFKQAFQKAQLKKQNSELSRWKNTEKNSETLQHLLDAMSYLNQALAIRPASFIAEKEKYSIGQEVIRITCLNQEYQLADYVAKDLQYLHFLGEQEKATLLQQIEEERTKSTREHLKRLNSWIEKFKTERLDLWTKERALLEISKMQEEEIFAKLVQILKEGTSYFLTSTQRNIKNDEFYQLMVHALGRLERPRAAKPLLESLSLLSEKWISTKKHSSSELNYLVALVHAIGNSKQKNTATPLNKIRWKIGEATVFWERTKTVYKQLLFLDEFSKVFPEDPDSFYLRAEQKSSRGDFAGAIEDLDVAIKLAPLFDRAFHSRGCARQDLGDIMGALADFNQTIKINPQHTFAYLNRGFIKQSFQKYKTAIEDYSIAIQLNENFIQAYNNRGFARQKLGDLKGAMEDYEKVLEIEPQHINAYVNLGSLKYEEGDFKGAIQKFNQALRLDPQSALAYSNRATVRQILQDVDGALEDFNMAIALDSTSGKLYFNRGCLQQELGNFEGALLDYTEAIRLNPELDAAYCNRGLLKKALKDYQGAMQDFNEAIRIAPDSLENVSSYLNRGQLKSAQKDYQGAIEDYNKALKIKPSYAVAYDSRGNAWRILKDYKKSIADFEKSLALEPRQANTFYNLGLLYRQMKQWDLAIESFEKGLLLEYHPRVANLLADLLIRRASERARRKQYEVAYQDLIRYKQFASQEHPKYKMVMKMILQLEERRKKQKEGKK